MGELFYDESLLEIKKEADASRSLGEAEAPRPSKHPPASTIKVEHLLEEIKTNELVRDVKGFTQPLKNENKNKKQNTKGEKNQRRETEEEKARKIKRKKENEERKKLKKGVSRPNGKK